MAVGIIDFSLYPAVFIGYNNFTGTVEGSTYDEKLRSLGLTGTLSDMQYKYLRNLGFSGAMSDMVYKHLKNLGYSGTVPDMLMKKARTEEFSSINKMMVITGLIPTALGDESPWLDLQDWIDSAPFID